MWDAIDSHTHDLSTSITKDDAPEPLPVRDIPPAPTMMRAVTPVYTNKVVTMVQRMEASPKPMALIAPPLTNSIVSAPTTIVPASTVPVVKTVPAYETREVVRELVRERSPERHHHHHTTETITLGHTRYGGQAHTSAQIPLS